MKNNIAEEVILDAALDVINEHSIANAKMLTIAKKADMLPSNLFYYFKNKNDLLFALIIRVNDAFTKYRIEHVDASVNSLKGKIGGFFRQKKDTLLNLPKYDRSQFDFWCLAQNNEKLREQYEITYTKWREHIINVINDFKPDISAKKKHTVAAVMVSMMMGISMQYLVNKKAFDLEDYFETCQDLILHILNAENNDAQSEF